MTLNQFFAENAPWILTTVFGAGAFWWSVRNLSKQLNEINSKFDVLDLRDRELDKEIGDLKSRVAVVEERDRVLDQLMTRIDDIWKHIMRTSGPK